MDRPRFPVVILGACAVALVTGCAQTGPSRYASHGVEVEPVLRIEQPVGTVAGQYAAGRIDLGEGRYEAAILRFRQALQHDPGFGAAYNGLGIAYGYTGRFELAAEAFRAALASGPSSAHLLNNLGFAELQAGRLDAARESLRRSLALDPANAGTAANMRLLEKVAATREHDVHSTALLPVVTAASRPLAVIPSAVPLPLPGSHAELITALTQASAAKVLGEAPNPGAYEIVVSRVSDTALVEVAKNVYEVQFGVRSPAPALAGAAAPGLAASGQGSTDLAGSRTPPVSPWQSVEPAALPSPLVRGSVAGSAAMVGQGSRMPEVIVTAVRVRSAALPRQDEQQTLAPVLGLEVSNGVGLHRLAARTAAWLERRGGARATRLSDYPGFGVRRTEIHYREGNLAAAQALERLLPVSARLLPGADLRAGTMLRLVVGRDMLAGPITQSEAGDMLAGPITQLEARDAQRPAS